MSNIYKIWFPSFESIVARDLTHSEVEQILSIRKTMVRDEYASYSPTEQDKYHKVIKLIEKKIVKYKSV